MHVEVCTTASAAWAVSCHLTTRGTAPCTHATADCRQPQQQRHHRPHRRLRHPCGSPSRRSPSLRLALRLLTRTRSGFTPAGLTPAHRRTHARTHARCQTSHKRRPTDGLRRVGPPQTQALGGRADGPRCSDDASPHCLGLRPQRTHPRSVAPFVPPRRVLV